MKFPAYLLAVAAAAVIGLSGCACNSTCSSSGSTCPAPAQKKSCCKADGTCTAPAGQCCKAKK